MIELGDRVLSFSFPEVHPEATLEIQLHRTFRVPDDGRDYPLPASLGTFPIEHVDDFADRVPASWLERGGVMVPMYQAEALWLRFSASHIDCQGTYPFAIKIATGKINAVTGGQWSAALGRDPQDYVTAARQPWLDGYCVSKGTVRQFVAVPLGGGYSVEEQVTGEAEFGGIQLQVYPMKRQVFEQRFPYKPPPPQDSTDSGLCFAHRPRRDFAEVGMGIAPGGRIRQQIFDDPYELDDWDTSSTSRCFVHLCNAVQWKAITGRRPPTQPITAHDYQAAGIPWFEYYRERVTANTGSARLASLETAVDHARTIGDRSLTDVASIAIRRVVRLWPRRKSESANNPG